MSYRESDDIPNRNPMFVFEQALSEVLDLPGHGGFASLASDNTAAAAHEVESWEQLAAVWLWQYLSAYNRHLHEREPDALADLETAVADLQESNLVEVDDVPALARYFTTKNR
jgi:hypothetical protein